MSCRDTYMIQTTLANLIPKNLQTHLHIQSKNNLPSAICLLLLLDEFVLVHIPRSRHQGLSARQRRQAVDKHILGHTLGGLFEERGQSGLALLLRSHEGLLSGLANQLDLWLRGAAHRQQRHGVALVDDAELRVRAAHVTLPVGVVGDVAGGKRDGIIVSLGVQGAGGRVSEVRIERHAVGAVGVEGKGLSDRLPDAGGLKSVFLRGSGSAITVHHPIWIASPGRKPQARI